MWGTNSIKWVGNGCTAMQPTRKKYVDDFEKNRARCTSSASFYYYSIWWQHTSCVWIYNLNISYPRFIERWTGENVLIFRRMLSKRPNRLFQPIDLKKQCATDTILFRRPIFHAQYSTIPSATVALHMEHSRWSCSVFYCVRELVPGFERNPIKPN